MMTATPQKQNAPGRAHDVQAQNNTSNCTSWKHRILALIDLLMLAWIVLAMAFFFGGVRHG